MSRQVVYVILALSVFLIINATSWENQDSNVVINTDNNVVNTDGNGPHILKPVIPGQNNGQQVFWIIDNTGNYQLSTSLPLYGRVQEQVIPVTSGQLVLEERAPNGNTETYNMGQVTENQPQTLWFYGDTPGTHQQRYSVNGQYSAYLTFYVGGNNPTPNPNPKPQS